MKIGKIGEIWRYPVKAMGGERLKSCLLQPNGLVGDRLWAVRDEARQEVQSCKTRPLFLQCQARYREPASGKRAAGVDITLPDGSIMNGDEPEIHMRLSELVGRKSTLQPIRPASDDVFYRRYKPDRHSWRRELEATFEREQGEPSPDLDNLPEVLVDHVSIPGSLFLVTPFHLITTASLSYLRSLNSASDWDVRRFRPNLVIETDENQRGLVEEKWIGSHLKIGEAIVKIAGSTVRCGAITRAQTGLDVDAQMLRTVVREADQNVGVYGEIEKGGLLHAGDEKLLLTA